MSKIMICAIATFFWVSTVCAADIEDRSLKGVPDGVSVAPRWSGFYTGGEAGFAVGTSTDKDLSLPVPVVTLSNTLNKNSTTVTGATYGGYFGYNWQVGPLVYGVEASFNGTSLGGSWTSTQIPVLAAIGQVEYDCEHDMSWFASATGRLGFAQGRVLLYGRGGFVWGNDETMLTAHFFDDTSVSEQDSVSRFGWTAGLGVEYAVNDRLSTRIEYSHLGFGGKEIFGGGDHVDVTFDTIKLGASYKLSNSRDSVPLQ
jgi:outer membrane immunogenic protein